MALRIEQRTIESAHICSRTKGELQVLLRFANGEQLSASLKGNPYRDLAGCRLVMRHPSPEPGGEPPAGLLLRQRGAVGEVTAARKVKVPLESGEGETAATWKNQVYLEWYSRANGRVVLEADEFFCSISEAEWDMSAEEEDEVQRAASATLSNFLDQICPIDRGERLEKESMDEFEWERFLRHSDDLSLRYAELIEKFGLEDEDSIARYMNWERRKESDGSREAWVEPAGDFSEEPEKRRSHPLQAQARALLDSVELAEDELNSPMAGLLSALVTVSAKLAGALASYESDYEPDAGFTIAQLKRCLVYIDDAVGQAQEVSPRHVQPLLEMRQSVIDLQQELRGAR